MQNSSFFRTLGLSSLSAAPIQSFGEITLVPLLRKDASPEIKLFHPRRIEEEEANKGAYALLPHGFIVHSERGETQAVFGTQLIKWGELDELRASRIKTRELPQAGRRPRFLALDLSTEGFLEYYFGSAPTAWEEYSTLNISRQTTPLQEWAKQDHNDIDDCIRSFEIHTEQTGVLVFIKQELAFALVLPSHDDYRSLHSSILEDLCRGMFGFYGRFPSNTPLPTLPNDKQLTNLDALRASVKRLKAQWATAHNSFSGGVLEVPLNFSAMTSIGPFRYKRFGSELVQTRENLLGEAIHRDSGRLEFLMTYKLTRSETRRSYLIEGLSRADWDLRKTAASMSLTTTELNERIRRAGLEYMLDQKVLNEMKRLSKLNKKKR